MRASALLALGLAGVLGLAAPPAAAQQGAGPGELRVAAGVRPDTVAVGDPFEVVVRVAAGGGAAVLFPELEPSDELHPLAPPRVSVAGGGAEHTAVYALAAFRPGALPPTSLGVAVVTGSDTVQRRVPLPLPVVASVLPAGDTVPPPRPAKSVLPWSPPAADSPPRRWPWLLLALLALLALALLAWLRRRRAPVAPDVAPGPRERALAALDAALAGTELQRRSFRAFYSGVTRTLRGYLAELSPAWGTELTTSELLERLRASDGAGPAAVQRLRALLQHADLVKFAPAPTTDAEARRFWESARGWVVDFPEQPAPDAAVEEAA